MKCNQNFLTDVSVIIPVHNSEETLEECLDSCIQARNELNLKIELSIYLDACIDRSQEIIELTQDKLVRNSNISLTFSSGHIQGGVAFAKNRCIQQSSGRYLCFMDSDDILLNDRIQKQFIMYKNMENDEEMYLIGSKFIREPQGSTHRFAKWANNLTQEQLHLQIFTSNGPTVVAPTWFCSRNVYDKVGGFDESHSCGFPEDLHFFYKLLSQGGKIGRHDEVLLTYRYHQHSATFSVKENTIWNMRIERLEKDILPNWRTFSIWNAGKQGRKFYWSLLDENRKKIETFCDVDLKKIKAGFYEPYDTLQRKAHRKIPIIDHTQVKPPLIICMKLDMTEGVFESILASKHWEEGCDYILFS